MKCTKTFINYDPLSSKLSPRIKIINFNDVAQIHHYGKLRTSIILSRTILKFLI